MPVSKGAIDQDKKDTTPKRMSGMPETIKSTREEESFTKIKESLRSRRNAL